MKQFVILPNECLDKPIQAFFHDDYEGGGKWKESGTIENMICTLKNDITPYSSNVLQNASQQLANILLEDLPQILQKTGKNNLTVCVIPRAKAESNYPENQKLFRRTIRLVVEKLNGFLDGTSYIIRHTDTQTTHRARWGHGGTGKMPYQGITKDTCEISENVRGRDILLIDDLYTKTVNIDEDAIQALLDKGVKSVVFYSVGKTVSRNTAI
jgi:phosphoribosylpyrophosphate synthetase